jgi:exopolysaccharide biosynthesis polyprenyl glycosylphosphotransferase
MTVGSMPDVLPLEDVAPSAIVEAPPRAPARSGDFAWSRACLATDALSLSAAVALAEVGASSAGVPATPKVWLLAFPALAIALLAHRGLYKPRLAVRLLDATRSTIGAISLAAMVVLSLRVLIDPVPGVASQSARLWAFAVVYVAGGRILLAWSELQARRRGEALRPTLIVGAGHVGRLVAHRLSEQPELGLRPVGFLDKDPLATDDPGRLPVLGASWDFERIVEEHGIERLIVTFSTAPHQVLLRLMRRSAELGVRVTFVPRLFESLNERLTVDYLGGVPLLTTESTNPRGWEFGVKHLLDRLLALILLLLLFPVLVASAAAVFVSLGRPILFRQVRVGRDDRPFQILKFRTMRPAAGEGSRPELPPDTAPGGIEGIDLRTGVGNVLRRTSIDELPQLLNVLRGEMSLVGPRPERREFVDLFCGTVNGYEYRHRVKAGITGWAQVNGLRGKTSISDRAEWDNHYIENWSLWLDVKIMLMTVLAVFGAYRTVE